MLQETGILMGSEGLYPVRSDAWNYRVYGLYSGP